MSTNASAVIARRRKLKLLAIEFLGGKCVRCGWDEHPAGFNIHHVNPSKKSFGIGSGNTRSWEKVKDEARKCILLCACCHLIVHATRDGHYFDEKNIPVYPDLVEHKPLWLCKFCETEVSYNNNRCRNCFNKQRQIIPWPPLNDLVQAILSSSYLAVSKELGVSDNAIRHHLKARGIDPRSLSDVVKSESHLTVNQE